MDKIDSIAIHKKENMQEHYHYIDRLKGLAILAVIMGHYLVYILSQMGVVIEVIGSFHMPLFMFLSGMLAKVATIRKVINKVFCFIMPVITIGTLYAYSHNANFSDLLYNSYKFGYWYLYVLSVFYIFLYSIGMIEKQFWGVILSIMIWGMLFFLNSFITNEWNDLFSIWIIKQYWPFFIAGYFFNKFSLMEKLSVSNWIYTLSFVVYFVSFTLWFEGKAYLYYLVSFSFVVAILYLFITREQQFTFIEKKLEYFGQNTLDIYIYHFFIISMVSLSDLGCWLEDTHNILLEVLLGVALSIVIAFLSIGIGRLIRTSTLLSNIIYGLFVKKYIVRIS